MDVVVMVVGEAVVVAEVVVAAVAVAAVTVVAAVVVAAAVLEVSEGLPRMSSSACGQGATVECR